MEDSSDDLWYLGTSPKSSVGIDLKSAVEVALPLADADDQTGGGFQVEFEVDSSTEVEEEEEEQEDSTEETDEDDDNDDDEEDLLGQEVRLDS